MNVLVSRLAVRVLSVGAVALVFGFSDVSVPAAAAQQGRVQQGGGSQPGCNREEQDYRRGYREGFQDGLRDGRDNLFRQSERRKSASAYERGYSQGYQAGFDRGMRERPPERRPERMR